MRDFETILIGFAWFGALLVFAGIAWFVYHLELFPRKRLRNIPFCDVEIGQIFYDFGGEDSELREYLKTGELEAQCLSLKEKPSVNFKKNDVVKIQVMIDLWRY